MSTRVRSSSNDAHLFCLPCAAMIGTARDLNDIHYRMHAHDEVGDWYALPFSSFRIRFPNLPIGTLPSALPRESPLVQGPKLGLNHSKTSSRQSDICIFFAPHTPC